MAQGYSRENGSRNRDSDQDRMRKYGQRGSGASRSRRDDQDDEGSFNQYSRGDLSNTNQRQMGGSSERSGFGRDNDRNEDRSRQTQGAFGTQGRDREDRSQMGGQGRGQQWGGGYNEGGYDQRGTLGGGETGFDNWNQNRGYREQQWGGRQDDQGQQHRDEPDWRGGNPQTRYGGNEDYPYSGQGRGQSYGRGYGDYDQREGRNRETGYQRNLDNQQHRAGRYDQDYLSWRDEQVRKLDEDYDAYRAENRSKFNDDFETWRTKRTSSAPKREKPGDKGRSKAQSMRSAANDAKDAAKH